MKLTWIFIAVSEDKFYLTGCRSPWNLLHFEFNQRERCKNQYGDFSSNKQPNNYDQSISVLVAHCGIRMKADVANRKQHKPEAPWKIVFMLYLYIFILLI